MFGGFSLTLLLSVSLGHSLIFWEDEMLGWMLLRDPTWHHMIAAWKQGADGGGILFYFTGRIWLEVFGPSEIAFRLFSATGFGLAFCVIWVALRRFYTSGVLAFALFNTWFFNPPIVTHMAEGRFYGLLMLGTALAFWLAVKVQEVEGSPWWLCMLFFGVHGSLVTSHMLGVVYSGNLLLSVIALDVLSGRRRPLLYSSGALSWLLLLGERTAIHATAQVGKPHFWTTPPTLSRFVGAYTSFSVEVTAVFVVLAVFLLMTVRNEQSEGYRKMLRVAFHARRSAYVLAAAFLLIPLEITIACLIGPSLFTNRYLMPVVIAQVFLTAEAVTLIHWPVLLRGRLLLPIVQRFALVGFAVGLVLWIFIHIRNILPQPEDYTRALTATLPKDIPVVCEDAWTFTALIGRQHASAVRYMFLLDWPESIAPGAPRLEVTEYHLMKNWKQVGYFSGSIQPIGEFLRDHPKFVLLHRDPPILMVEPNRIGNPLYERFSHDSAYEVRPYGSRTKDGFQEAWMVCQKACSENSSPGL